MFTPGTLNLIKENVEESVGFIILPDTRGTGFRVGKKSFMTAYHVLDDAIGGISVYIYIYKNVYYYRFVSHSFNLCVYTSNARCVLQWIFRYKFITHFL